MLEDGRVVDRPVGALAGFWTIVSTTAAVFVSIEFHASGLASNGPATAVLNDEFSRTDGIQIREATSTTTVILPTTTTSDEGTVLWNYGDGQIVAIDKGDVVVVSVAHTIESKFGKGYWRDTSSSATFDPVSAVSYNKSKVTSAEPSENSV